MVNIEGFNLMKHTGIPPVQNKVTIKLTLTDALNASVSFAHMKYNKKQAFMCVKDDGGVEDYTIGYAYLKGGIPAKDGVVYPGVYYTDGAGTAVPYRMTFAINTNNPRTPDNPFGLTSWDQYKIMLRDGFGIANHSRDHGGYNTAYQIKQAEKEIYNNTGLRTTTFVVPTNDAGYANGAPSLGYLMVGSQGAWDDYGDAVPTYYNPNGSPPKYGVYYGGRLDTRTFDRNKLLFSRFYAGEGQATALNDIRDMADDVFLRSKAGTANFIGHWFHHGLNNAEDGSQFSYWRDLIQHIKNHPDNNDTTWMPTMQEFTEYYQVKALATTDISINGNELTYTVNLGAVPDTNLLRDFSLMIGGATIQGVTVEGADSFSFNPATGLVNIYKKNIAVTDPNTDVMPASIISATRNGVAVTLTYDKAVTQDVFGNANGNAYDVQNNAVLTVTGVGTVWTLNCQNPVAAGSTFTYRMQRGNATDGNGMKVITYINYPIV